MPRRKGLLIAIYGANNTGKTTQARLLVRNLRAAGYRASYVKYPRYDLSPSGTYINRVLRKSRTQNISEEELQMWYVLNRFQAEPDLRRKLERGEIIIAEDYIGTGIAWGMTKGANLAWLETINAPLLHENIGILLHGVRFLQGKETRHLHERDNSLMKKAAAIHLRLAKQYGWKIVKAARPIETVAQDVVTIVQKRLPKIGKRRSVQ